MTGEGHETFAALHVPDSGGGVVAAGEQPTAVRRERQVLNDVFMSEVLAHDPLIRQGDQADEVRSAGPGITTNRQILPVGGNRGAVDHPFHPRPDRRADDPQGSAAGEVPDADRLVVRDGDQLLAVRSEQDLVDAGGVPSGVERQ
jgi:hypothetical protein